MSTRTLNLSPLERSLIDRWQRDLPLVREPFAAMAAGLGVGEGELIASLSRLQELGTISRIGATVRPNTAGASLLAAMAVPPERLEEVAALVNAESGVNHNYEREHTFNLWFVLTGASEAALAAALARIRRATGLDVLELPLEKSYFIDLGFSLQGERGGAARPARSTPKRAIDATDRALLEGLTEGMAIVARPYKALAARAGIAEDAAIDRIGTLVDEGIITRLGLIVRHRTLGFTSNAMAVWDVPDEDVDRIGALFAAQPFVTLCYRRPRRLPHWSCNLFCMVHGRERETVLAQVAGLTRIGGLAGRTHHVLFSRRCFRQRGPSLKAA